METSTKILLAGLAAVGVVLYVKTRPQTSGPALPKTTPIATVTPAGKPALPGAAPGGIPSNSPEVSAAINALQSVPAQFPNSPEAAAALSTLQSSPPNSPEAQAALSTLQGFPTSPEAQAALNILQGIPLGGLAVPTGAPTSTPSGGTVFDGHGTGVLNDSTLVKNGDIVDVDMFRSGMAIPMGVPAVGLIFMNVDSLEGPGDPTKFFASFVTAELRVFGQQTVNRSAIVKKVALDT